MTHERTVPEIMNIVAKEGHEIEQLIAQLFPEQFPLYPEDWNAGEDRCVGEHIPITMVMLACDEIRRLRAELEQAKTFISLIW